jgi:hypothetical protein
MENKAYVLWEISGEYEDLRAGIYGVYTTRELAECWMNKLTEGLKIKKERMDFINDTHECKLSIRDCPLCTEKWDLWEKTNGDPIYEVEEFTVQDKLISNSKGDK